MDVKNNVDERLINFVKSSPKKSLRTGNTCVIYTRVSSKEQAENNTSLETQLKFCDEYCLKRNYPVKKHFGGTYESAKSDDREEFEKLIAYVKKDATIRTIVVYSYDRFSRTGANAIYIMEQLRNLGVKVVAVTQEVDDSTPSGKLQKDILLSFSQYDNEQRKDKCITGIRENVMQGYWVNATPFGYDNLCKKEKAKNHKYVINKNGKLLIKGFEMRANGGMTDKDIVKELNLLGCTLKYKRFVPIISNPFYCGYVTNSLVAGNLYKGHHPALISVDLFCAANNIKHNNSSKGVAKKFKIEELPLKTFAKDELSLSPFTGYKQKGIFYYKSRHNGTCVNVRASRLNDLFTCELKKYQYIKEQKQKLRELITQILNNSVESSIEEKKIIRKQIAELSNKLESLEKRFIEQEITKELFEKYSVIYKNGLTQLEEKLSILEIDSSNLEKGINKGLEIAENVSVLWDNGTFDVKTKLQKLLFPDGIVYNKINGSVRTLNTNSLFALIPLLTKIIEENENACFKKNRQLSNQVGMTTASSNFLKDDLCLILLH